MSFELGKPVKEFVKAVLVTWGDFRELLRELVKPPKAFVDLDAQRLVAATSAALVGVVLFAGAYYDPAAVGEGLVIVVRTVFMWGILASGVYGFARVFGGLGTLSQTMAAVFKVMPVAYVAGAIAAVVAAIIMRPYTEEWRFIMSTTASIVGSFGVLAWVLPRRIAALHKLGRAGRTAMYGIPAFVLATNLMFAAVPAYNEMKIEQNREGRKNLIRESWTRYWPVFTVPATKYAVIPGYNEMKIEEKHEGQSGLILEAKRYWPVFRPLAA